MRTIKQEWDSYYNGVMKVSGIEINSVQYIETRRSFYAGFYSMLNMAKEIGNPEVSEEKAIKWLDTLNKEITRFYIDVKLGLK